MISHSKKVEVKTVVFNHGERLQPSFSQYNIHQVRCVGCGELHWLIEVVLVFDEPDDFPLFLPIEREFESAEEAVAWLKEENPFGGIGACVFDVEGEHLQDWPLTESVEGRERLN
jgi:hypothetical protein